MSGVEIIGLILGGLPLVISAIEHYRDGLDPLKDYFRYDNTLKSLRTRLRIQQDLFEGTLQRLLLEDLSHVQAKALFPNSDNPVDRKLWGTKEVDDLLHRRLGSKYGNFMDVVREMEVVMRQLMEKLDFDIDEKPKWNESSPTKSVQAVKRSKWEWRKIRRSFGRKDRETLIRDFERYNWDIARYVEQREILAPSSKPRPAEVSRYYHSVRENACGLYEVLENGWKCRCIRAHHANLQLERRNDSQSIPEFNMSLSFLHCPGQNLPESKAWLEAKVDVDTWEDEIDFSDASQHQIQKDLTAHNTPTVNTPLTLTSLKGNITLPFTPKKPSLPSVQIVAPTLSNTHVQESSTTQKIKIGAKNYRRAPRISSLCEAIQAASSPNTDLGFLANASTKRGIYITAITATASSNVEEPVSLDTFLQSSRTSRREPGSTCKLSRQQRLRIAVTLAHGVLQLHKSPWLNEAWSKNDIYFFSRGCDAQRRPMIEQPYVSRSFWPASEKAKELEPHGLNGTDIFSNQIINKSLFALGIVLIELCFNKTFEDLCAEARSGPNSANLSTPPDTAEISAVATSLIEDVYEEQGMQYGYVVQRCLKCEFGVQDSKKQLDFDAFRALVYEGVLAPLEEDLKRYSL